MTKKKTTTITKPVKSDILPIDQEPKPELPEHQIDEESTVNQVEQPVETKTEPETTPTTEGRKVESQAESTTTKSEPEPEPIIEPSAPKSDAKPNIETPAPKPKPLNMVNLQAELEELRKIVLQQSQIITELKTAPVKTRKPPVSNGKKQIQDTLTGKIYPSKNNVYQSLLKAGELKDLVAKGVFGAIPEKNSFGCYALFNSFPGRFVEVKDENTESTQV